MTTESITADHVRQLLKETTELIEKLHLEIRTLGKRMPYAYSPTRKLVLAQLKRNKEELAKNATKRPTQNRSA